MVDPALAPLAAASMPWQWEIEPGVAIPIVLASAAYAFGMARQGRARRLPRGAPARAAAFAAAIASLVLALMSPLARWGDERFSAHMAQHLILMMVAPALLVMGRPVVVLLWALPRRASHGIAGWWQRSRLVRPLAEAICAPLTAWLVLSAALWFWHMPGPYRLAFDDPVFHALEHLSFLGGAILFWRVVIQGPPASGLSLGATMLFVMTFAMENAMLAAILIFAPRVLYAVHAQAPAWSSLTPLADQQLAGVLMWSVTGVIDLAALCWLFVRWLSSGSRRVRFA